MVISHWLDWRTKNKLWCLLELTNFSFLWGHQWMINCPTYTFTADDPTTSGDQSSFAFTCGVKCCPRRRQLPGAQITSPSLTHCALLSTGEPLDTATVKIIALLVGSHLRCIPCSQALKAQWLSDSRMWKCHESCPASYGACASPGTGTELELGRAWGWQHMRTQGPHSEWKCNPTLQSPSPRCLLHWAAMGSSVMGSALRCMCLHVVVYVTVYIIWTQWLLEVTVRVRRK